MRTQADEESLRSVEASTRWSLTGRSESGNTRAVNVRLRYSWHFRRRRSVNEERVLVWCA